MSRKTTITVANGDGMGPEIRETTFLRTLRNFDVEPCYSLGQGQ